jgi:2-methylcitrate dehydratase PrpD
MMDMERNVNDGLTNRLGVSIERLATRELPRKALDTARRGLVDYIGVLLAGSQELPAQTLLRAIGPPRSSEARIVPSGVRVASQDAALVNGVAGHVLDYDDVALGGHPSAVLFPALLAEAEALDATAADLLRGYIAGYETWATLWKASPVSLHARGWHPSGVFGPIAVAAGCASLRRLDAKVSSHAIALAAVHSGGLIANFGTSAKSFQVGRAAAAGIFTTRLAEAGFDASATALEHESGFLTAYAGGSRAVAGGFGDPDWFILSEGLDIKMYPMCYATHRLIDSALQLRQQRHLVPDQIATVELRLGQLQSTMLHSHRPKTSLEAKFSAEFAAAAALVAGSVGMAQLDQTFVLRPDVQTLMAKTKRQIRTEIAVASFSPSDQASVTLTDGTVIEGEPVSAATGSRHKPPSRAEALTKFVDTAGLVLNRERAELLFGRLWDIGPETKIASILDDAEAR